MKSTSPTKTAIHTHAENNGSGYYDPFNCASFNSSILWCEVCCGCHKPAAEHYGYGHCEPRSTFKFKPYTPKLYVDSNGDSTTDLHLVRNNGTIQTDNQSTFTVGGTLNIIPKNCSNPKCNSKNEYDAPANRSENKFICGSCRSMGY